MDQIIPRIVSFDRFELDLMRGCARVAGQDLALRPKAFQLLCYLAENAGRLVSKQELHDAIWPQVTVSDDALVQCVRELRQKLRDSDRTVIQTVPRRGYLLNAAKAVPGINPAAAAPQPEAPATPALPRPWFRGPARWAAAAIVVLGLMLASSPAGRWAPAPPRDLLSGADVRELAKLAADKELPLPAFHITSLAEDVPDAMRRFVGVWVSDTGWQYSDRQLMLIITNVTKTGHVSGYFVNGPSKPYSRTQGPAFSMNFKGHINAGTLRYDGYVGMYLANLDREGTMEFKLIFQDGVITKASLKPIWTLPKSGRSESAGRADASTRL